MDFPSAVVNVINQLPGLPYSAAYAAWDAHVSGCLRCRSAIASTALLMDEPGTLCETGQELDAELGVMIRLQHEEASLN